MNDLARKRSARDIWISKSHIAALAVGVVMLVVASFAVGYGMGRKSVDLPVAATPSFGGEVGDEALVELLGRVDATATPDGGVRDLTFPDALAGQGGEPHLPAAPIPAGNARTLPAGGAPALQAVDTAPKGRWTVAARSCETLEEAAAMVGALESDELEGWVGVEQVDGQPRWRAAIGGWGSRTEAEDAAEKLAPTIAALGGKAIVVRY